MINLKPKEMLVDRRSENDRRMADKSLSSNKIERRKRPDRRLNGLDVDEIDVSEEEFMEIFSQFLPHPV